MHQRKSSLVHPRQKKYPGSPAKSGERAKEERKYYGRMTNKVINTPASHQHSLMSSNNAFLIISIMQKSI